MYHGAGAPLYETLCAAFPSGMLPQGIADNIQHKIRRRLRDIGYRVEFPEGEDWDMALEAFSIASLERIYKCFGEQPWFWVLAWPAVFGAAAADFWPEIATPGERRKVASEACAAHLESMLMRTALGANDGVGLLPMPAVRALKATGLESLPCLPEVAVKDGSFAMRQDLPAPRVPLQAADINGRTGFDGHQLHKGRSMPVGAPTPRGTVALATASRADADTRSAPVAPMSVSLAHAPQSADGAPLHGILTPPAQRRSPPPPPPPEDDAIDVGLPPRAVPPPSLPSAEASVPLQSPPPRVITSLAAVEVPPAPSVKALPVKAPSPYAKIVPPPQAKAAPPGAWSETRPPLPSKSPGCPPAATAFNIATDDPNGNSAASGTRRVTFAEKLVDDASPSHHVLRPPVACEGKDIEEVN